MWRSDMHIHQGRFTVKGHTRGKLPNWDSDQNRRKSETESPSHLSVEKLHQRGVLPMQVQVIRKW